MRILLVLLLSVAWLAGCSQSVPKIDVENPATNVVNQICPIMGGKVTPEGGTAQWDGKLVGFCCPECSPKWEALTDSEKREKLSAAAAKAEGKS